MRFYTMEVAEFLLIGLGKLRKWAKSEGLLHHERSVRTNNTDTEWLTEWGMRRAVAYWHWDLGRDQVEGTRNRRIHVYFKEPKKKRGGALKPWQFVARTEAERRFWQPKQPGAYKTTRPGGSESRIRTRRVGAK